MSDFQEKYLLKRQDYGILYPYITSERVTDVNWNGRQLWINDLDKGRYMSPEILSSAFVERFVSLISHMTGKTFNRMNPVLEAETEELRISIVHGSVACSGITLSLRKIPAIRRMEKEDMIRDGYCSEEVHDFLVNCVSAHCSIVICGLPGAGKTELLKYLTKYIPARERAITIEDIPEIHYQKINPNKDCVEMRVAENFSYAAAIKASLRQLPQWIILSEARSEEVRYLLESLSTGASGFTTIHTDDVRNIPDRMKNMAGFGEDLTRVVNDTYRFVDVGVLVSCRISESGEIHRRVEQIGLFDRRGIEWKETVNEIVMLMEDGKMISRKLPQNLWRKFALAEIRKPFGRSAI